MVAIRGVTCEDIDGVAENLSHLIGCSHYLVNCYWLITYSGLAKKFQFCIYRYCTVGILLGYFVYIFNHIQVRNHGFRYKVFLLNKFSVCSGCELSRVDIVV
jgi:hypothetical protein